MAERVTQKMLDRQIVLLNRALGRPEAFAGPETEIRESGREMPRINPGHIALDQDMTGTRVVEITSDKGAQTHISPYRMTKRETEIFLNGMMEAINLTDAR